MSTDTREYRGDQRPRETRNQYMPEHQLSDGTSLYYEDDYFGDPWSEPAGTVLFIHGFAESTLAWNQWVPYFAGEFRTIRIDMRGFGNSTPMARDYAWSMDGLAGDSASLLDALGVGAVHLVSAKIGGIPALRFAALYPERVKSLSMFASPAVGATMVKEGAPTEEFEGYEGRGVEHWVRRTNDARMGTELSPDAKEWWIQYMGSVPLSTAVGFMEAVGGMDASVGCEAVKCPVIMYNSTNGRLPSEELRPWVEKIPQSQFVEYESTAHHLASAHPHVFAPKTLEFVRQHNG
jgi:pimeloyl-ACP methyl ester carboxylesterase